MTLPLDTALRQCRLHADRLRGAVQDAGLPLASLPKPGSNEALIRTLDQMVLRFIKLQDTMSEHVLRAFCTDILLEPVEDLPFIDVLNRLEKQGYLLKADWDAQRRLRNALTHEYPDQPERQLAVINELPAFATQLVGWLARVEAQTNVLRSKP